MASVVVCGSLNMDVIVQSARRPLAGETILDGKVSFLPGGKGSNQAIAAARLGAKTAMMGAVGNDVFGKTLRDVLVDNGVDASGVKVVRGETTGVAVISEAMAKKFWPKGNPIGERITIDKYLGPDFAAPPRE